MSIDNAWSIKRTVSTRNASMEIGISQKTLQRIINHSVIECRNQRILKSDIKRLKSEHESYIGNRSFMLKHSNERFDARIYKHRKRFNHYLEDNGYFGFQIIYPKDILTGESEKEDFYFLRADEAKLDELCAGYFKEYGVSAKEKAIALISGDKTHPMTRKHLEGFLRKLKKDKIDNTFSEFIQLALSSPDVSDWNPNTVNSLVKKAGYQGTKKMIPDFFNYVTYKEKKQTCSIALYTPDKGDISRAPKAYSVEMIMELARIFFDLDYDKEYHLTEKALEKSLFVEMWSYLSLHFFCGARNGDICRIWAYLDLEKNNFLNVNFDTLKTDLLNDSISKDVYRAAARYVLTKMVPNETGVDTETRPSKTGKGRVFICVGDSLDCFIGKLMLIAEYHHIQHSKRNALRNNPRDIDDGRMKNTRVKEYCAWTQCGLFFGKPFTDVFGFVNINSRSLTKSLIQGLEDYCIRHGISSLKARTIAAAARGHVDLCSLIHYERDQNYRGVKKNDVIKMLFERGVFGFSLYSVLVATFGDDFKMLPPSEQTKIMSSCTMTAFEVELAGLGFEVESIFLQRIMNGNDNGALRVVDSLVSMALGGGNAKDRGVICLRTALGEPCNRPTCKSCIGSICPSCILTQYAIEPWIKIFRDYYQKAAKKDDPFRWKYVCILKELVKKTGTRMFDLIKRQLSEDEGELFETNFRRCLDGNHS